MQRTGDEYTDDILARAEKVIAELQAMSARMKDKGDATRAGDLDEAIQYIEGAVDFNE